MMKANLVKNRAVSKNRNRKKLRKLLFTVMVTRKPILKAN